MPDLNHIQFRYSTVDFGERRPQHRIEAVLGDRTIGRLGWHGVTHRVTYLDVEPEYSRQGIATEMWKRAQQIRPKPKHSPDRTAMGNAWAKKVGGHLPRKVRYEFNDYNDDEWDKNGNPI